MADVESIGMAVAAEIMPASTVTPDVVQPQGSVWGMVLYLAVVCGIIYFLMVRPNKRRMAEYKKMLDGMAVGNRVLAAGIYGTIKKINDNSIEVEIAKGVVVEINKNAVANVVE